MRESEEGCPVCKGKTFLHDIEKREKKRGKGREGTYSLQKGAKEEKKKTGPNSLRTFREKKRKRGSGDA